MTKREELYLKGIEMIKQFAKLNNIDISDIDFFVRFNKKECPKGFNRYINYSGLCIYKTKRKNRYSIFVNLPKYKNMNDYCVYFNEIVAEKKREFFNAHFQDISNSVSIGDYKKYVIDDKDELILAPKCPVSVKAISLFNHLAHKNGQDNLRITSGKIKYYYIKTGPKATDIDYFGFPAGLDETWFPPCNRTVCWDKNIIVPMNRFANVIHMPLLTANGEYSLSLF